MVKQDTGLMDQVFPTSSLPLDLDEAVAYLSDPRSCDDCLYIERSWFDLSELPNPTSSDGWDALVCSRLNKIVEAAKRCNSFCDSDTPTRKWTGTSASRTPLGVTDQPGAEACQRFPDGVLMPFGIDPSNTGVKRGHADAFIEIKSGQDGTYLANASAQLKENVRLAFGAQYDRRFILGITLIRASLSLWYFDRAESLQCSEIDIHENPREFLRVLCGFAFGTAVSLGYDCTITPPNSLGSRSVDVGGTTYQIQDVLHMESTLRGRGTIILRVHSQDGKTFIIKDSWIDVTRPEKEWEILKAAGDIEGIVHYVAHERVRVDGVIDSTQIIRDKVGISAQVGKIETREHYRLVLQESGVSLKHFKTRRELLSVLIDAVEAHKDMYEIQKVLHRDISFHNILISEYEGRCPGERLGRLIDFGYSKTVTRSTEGDPELHKNHRSGTLEFMSVQLLISEEDIEHEAHHDLESFFYVLCWACIVLEGPGRYNRALHPLQTQLHRWMDGQDERSIGKEKLMNMSSMFGLRCLMDDFQPYFDPLKDTVLKLWRILDFPNFGEPDYNPPTHEAFLGVLKSARDALPLVEDPPADVGNQAGRAQAVQPTRPRRSELAWITTSSAGRKRGRQAERDDDIQDLDASDPDPGTSSRSKRSRIDGLCNSDKHAGDQACASGASLTSSRRLQRKGGRA